MCEKSQTSSQIKVTRLKKVYNLKSNDNVHISWKRKDLEVYNFNALLNWEAGEPHNIRDYF